MKKSIIAVLLLAVASLGFGQEKVPQLSSDAKVSLLRFQLKQKQLESQYLQLQNQMTGVQSEFLKTQKSYTDAVEAAYKEAGVSKEKWDLDTEKLEFTKKPEPPPPAKKEEPKKP